MAKITISAHEVRFNGGGTPAFIRIYASRTFINGDHQTVTGGEAGSKNYVRQIAVSSADGLVSIPSLTGANRLDSTVIDAAGRCLAVYTVTLHAAGGAVLATLFQNIRIPANPTTTTWPDLAMIAETLQTTYKPGYYDQTQIDRKLADLSTAPPASDVLAGKMRLSLPPASLSDPVAVGDNDPRLGAVSDATVSAAGKTKLSVAPVSSSNPIAVGDNDTRLVKNLAVYGNSLSAAVSAIGSTSAAIVITEPVTVSASLTLPRNITLDAQNIITVASGQTLTIGAMKDAGSRRIFAGTGNVRFSKNAVSRIKTVWWTGAADNINIDFALSQAVASANQIQGTVEIGSGKWLITQSLALSNGVTICGNGNFPLASGGTVLSAAAGSTPSSIFSIGESVLSLRFRDLVLDGVSTTGVNGVLMEGNAPNTSGDISFSHVTFSGLLNGIYHYSLSGTWQMTQIILEQCIFQQCRNAGIKANSINSAWVLNSTNFALYAGAKGLDIDGIGAVAMTGGEVSGSGHGGGDIFIHTKGAHGAISITGLQDEAVDTFIQNDASDVTGILNLFGNLVQGKLQLNQSMTLTSVGNNYTPQSLRVGAGAEVRIVSLNDTIRTDTGNWEDPPTPLTGDALRWGKDANTFILSENNVTRGAYRQRFPQRYISPVFFEGNPSNPVVAIGATGASGESKTCLRIGRIDANEAFEYYYDMYRSNGGGNAGRLVFNGNQSAYAGYDFQNPVYVPDDAYNASTWDGSNQTLTKNAFRDVIETKADKNLSINAQTGTTYTLSASDNGRVITLSNASGITVTVPSGLGAGFNCILEQLGAGQITIAAGSGAGVFNRQSHAKSAGQYAQISLIAHTANNFILGGDTAA